MLWGNMWNNVNHPEHYRAPGKKECIVEMLDIFGKEYVQHFCLLNMYKYRYRHTMKNGAEDLQKAEWYKAKFLELDGNLDEIAKVLKHTEGFPKMLEVPQTNPLAPA